MQFEKAVSMAEKFKNTETKVLTDFPLSKLTTFGVGGRAKIVAFPTNLGQIQKILDCCVQNGVKCIVIGNGSNILASDNSFDGLVLVLGKNFCKTVRTGTSVFALSGTSTRQLYLQAHKSGLCGGEFLYTLPARVGGAVAMNAGCFGSDIKSIVKNVWVLDKQQGVVQRHCTGFSYRTSNLHDSVVLMAEFEFERGDEMSLAKKMWQKKVTTQPLTCRSAGSFFANSQAGSTAKILDNLGLKGLRVGDAVLSKLHAGFVTNCGNATARDILRLTKEIRHRVFEETGVLLTSEVKFLGEDDDNWGLSHTHIF